MSSVYRFIWSSLILALVIVPYTSHATDPSVMLETRKAADVMATLLKSTLGATSPLLITSLVDESDYSKSNPLAKLITDQIAIDLSQKGFYIVDIKLGKGLRLSQEGSAFMLTTDLKDLLVKDYEAEGVLVGTYLIGEKNIIVSLRVVALENGKILAGHTYTLDLTPDVEVLLLERKTQRNIDTILKQYERKQINSVYTTTKNAH